MIETEVAVRHSPGAIEEEILAFELLAERLRRGEITEEEFRPFRLKHGIYGQRQPGFQMVRVKIPSGLLNPQQLRALAGIAEEFSTGRGHVTTRENCQFHFVQMGHVPAIMRRLAACGLTTREACGNTVRNVTSCPLAGLCRNESFDVTPYALATTRFFLRHPEFPDLPRKFKIAFSGCEDDGNCAAAAIHDIGLIARLRGSNGTARKGFRVLVGGGLGSLPTEAQIFAEFLSEEELFPALDAILRIFNEHGNRGNKHKARMKFVLREKGIEEFKRLVVAKRAEVTTPAEVFTVSPPPQPSLVPLTLSSSALNGEGEDYERWLRHNLEPQRQPGFGIVWIKLPAGTVLTRQLLGLASLIEKFSLSVIRIAISQDLILPWTPLHRAAEIYRDLRALELVTPGARTIADVTACPGATTCNLGITRSLTLAEVLAEEFAHETDAEIQKIRVKISGCPNSCGHHHIAEIGLYGNARKVEDRQAPYYQLMLAGRVARDGVRFARQVMPLPARRIPAALRSLLNLYQHTRWNGETFGDWAERTSDAAILEHLGRYADVGDQEADFYVDWGDRETYSLKLGRGECAT